jgi:predicted CXXCH cytochrome family protein
MIGWFGWGASSGASNAPVAQAAPQAGVRDSDVACAGCHREIYERYRKTPMAHASGPAADGFLAAKFNHEASGVSYQILKEAGKVYLTFEREPQISAGLGGEAPKVEGLNGRRELRYFLGSGKRGRTFLFEQDGYWFEIPINWYAKKRVWDMAPNYQNATEMPLALPVDPGCLRCHSSGAQAALPEARNKYAGEPFLQGGITCAACHGDTAAHVASGGRVELAKIGEMPAVRRDSICLSCHLEGDQVVVHQGKRLVDFRPGESVFDYASYFVRAGGNAKGERATSQWEALLESGCKRGARERLTCTSCHDPHGSTSRMTDRETAAFYRGKCLACHDAGAAGGGELGKAGFAASHHPENPDCVSCHMPRANSSDIAHEQVTDHRIPRLASSSKATTGKTSEAKLRLVGTGGALAPVLGSSDRDFGLAYAAEAARGDRSAMERARELLRQAEASPAEAADHELHAQLGFVEQVRGDKQVAAREYARALAADPYDSFAAGNLGLLRAGAGQDGAAEQLWDRAFQDDPVQLKMGMNLALVECGLGKREASLATLDRLLMFSPDDGAARKLKGEIISRQHVCRPR